MRKQASNSYAAQQRRTTHAAGPCIVVQVGGRTRAGFVVRGTVLRALPGQRGSAQRTARTQREASAAARRIVGALRQPAAPLVRAPLLRPAPTLPAARLVRPMH